MSQPDAAGTPQAEAPPRVGAVLACPRLRDGDAALTLPAPEMCLRELVEPTLAGEIATGPIGSLTGACCVRQANIDCAVSLYAAAGRLGHPRADAGIAQVLTDRISAAAMIANEALVDAFSAPLIVDPSNLNHSAFVSEVRGPIVEGRRATTEALRYVLQADRLTRVLAADPVAVGALDYPLSRALAVLLARDAQLALHDLELDLRHDASADDLTTKLRSEVARFTVQLGLFQAIARSHEPDVGLVSDFASLTTSLSLFGELYTAIRGYAGDDSGFRDYFLARLAGAAGQTSSSALLDGAGAVVGATSFDEASEDVERQLPRWVSGERDAGERLRVYEGSLAQLAEEIRELTDQVECRLQHICGPGGPGPCPIDPAPALDACGEDANSLAGLSTQEIARADSNFRNAEATVDELEARLEREWDLLAEIDRIQAREVAVVQAGDAEANRQSLRQIRLNTKAERLSLYGQTAASTANNIGSIVSVAYGNPAGAVRGLFGLAGDAVNFGFQFRAITVKRSAQLAGLAAHRASQGATLQLRYLGNEREDLLRLESLAQLEAQIRLAELEATRQLQLLTQAEARAWSLVQERDRLLDEVAEVAGRHLEQDHLNEPTFRILRDRTIRDAADDRDKARRALILLMRAFEYDKNHSLVDRLGLVHDALSTRELARLAECVRTWAAEYDDTLGPQEQQTVQVSLRRLLSIAGPIVDPADESQCIDERSQLLDRFYPGYDDDIPFFGVRFPTPLLEPADIVPMVVPGGACAGEAPGPIRAGRVALTALGECNAKLTSVRVRVIGDLPGADATVYLKQSPETYQRSCTDEVEDAPVVLQHSFGRPIGTRFRAGIGAFGDGAGFIASGLEGRSLHAAWWELQFPFDGPQVNPALDPDGDGIDAADLVGLEDIVFELTYTAYERRNAGDPPAFACDAFER